MAEENYQPVPPPQIESHGRLMDAVERRAKVTKIVEYAILGVLFLVMIGLVFRSTSSSKTPDTKVNTTVQTPDVKKDVQQGEEDTNLERFSLLPGGPVKKRDPFSPFIVPKSSSSSTQPVHDARVAMAPPLAPVDPVMLGRNLPNLPAPGSKEMQPEPDPTANMKVTGILYGDPKVAIIRDGESGRHFVRVGDKIGERLTVLSIERGRVLLQAGGKNVVLTLGGNKDAS